jgi:hypothetical protein
MIDKLVLPGETLAINASGAPIEVALEAERRFVGSLDVSSQIAVPRIALRAVCMLAMVTAIRI